FLVFSKGTNPGVSWGRNQIAMPLNQKIKTKSRKSYRGRQVEVRGSKLKAKNCMMTHIQMVAGDDESADADRVRNGLYAFNLTTTLHSRSGPVAFFLKDDDGQVFGGILGYEWGGWLHITHLWVSVDLRGLGFGKLLLGEAEEYAINNVCRRS